MEYEENYDIFETEYQKADKCQETNNIATVHLVGHNHKSNLKEEIQKYASQASLNKIDEETIKYANKSDQFKSSNVSTKSQLESFFKTVNELTNKIYSGSINHSVSRLKSNTFSFS